MIDAVPIALTDSRTGCLIKYLEIHLPVDGGLQCVTHSTLGDQNELSSPTVAGRTIAAFTQQQGTALIIQEHPAQLLSDLSSECGVALHAVLTIPVFRLTELTAVVVIGLDCPDGDVRAAVETWQRDERDELAVGSSWYQGLCSLEFISRYVRLPKGADLPGQIWKHGRPELIHDPGQSCRFMRPLKAEDGIDLAVGLPLNVKNGFASSVVMMLNSELSPLADGIEVWTCVAEDSEDEENDPVVVIDHVLNRSGLLADDTERREAVERISETCEPCLISSAGPEQCQLLAIPSFRGGHLGSVLCFLFRR